MSKNKESQKIIGTIEVSVIDRNGDIKDHEVIHNVITNTGKAAMANRLIGSTDAAFTYLALGTGTTTEAATDTALESEITDSGLARTSATTSRVTTTVTNDSARLEYTWTATASKAVTECGVFNASSSGTMLGHKVFSAKNVASWETINVKYTIQFS